MGIWKRVIIITFLLAFKGGLIMAMEELKLVPLPREIKLLEGELKPSSEWIIWLEQKSEDELCAAELLQREAKACFNWDWQISPEPAAPSKKRIVLKSGIVKDTDPELFKTQGYYLWIKPEEIIIEAPTAVGRFYGVQTLRQLFRTAKNQSLPLLEIKDYPALEWRGVSDDISRGQVSQVNDFIEIIRTLAFYKKNLYQPYIEDMFRFQISPDIGKERGAITKEEMALMVAEAKKNHIVLTPVFECLGHQDRLLSLPENRKFAEVQDPKQAPWSFSPVLPETLEFIKELIAELAEATPSPFFHIGGDESWDVGKGTSKKLVEEIGVGKVHARFFTRLNEYIKERHKRQMMLYGDMLLHHPEALVEMPKDCIIVDWHYFPAEDYPSVKQFKDAGFKYIMASPAIWSWSCFYPNYNLGFKNVATFAEVAKREKLMGCITSSWGDEGAENLRENNWTGFAFSAAAEWEEVAPDLDKFLSRFVAVHYGIDSPELVAIEKKVGWLDYLEERAPAKIFHRQPKIKPEKEEWLNKLQTLEKNMEEAREKVQKIRERVRFHQEHLDVLDHVARRYLFLARKCKTLDKISRSLGEKKIAELSWERQKEIVQSLENLHLELTDLTADYERLWLRRNKFPKLDFNLERLQNQRAGLQEFITLAYAGELTPYKEPQIVWFWFPEEEPTKSASIGKKYFLRLFNVDKDYVESEIKCWADDKAVVYLNGEKLLEASYYSPPAKRKNLKLKKGKNFLAIEAENNFGAAGILLLLEITFKDGSRMMITGDGEWRAAEKVKDKWQRKVPKGKNWRPVMLLGTGLIEPWSSIDW